MRYLTDPVTEAYDEFFLAKAQTVFSATLADVQRSLADVQPRILTRRDYTTVSDEDVNLKGERLLSMARAISERNDRARLLLLFRKTSHELTSDLLRELSGGRTDEVAVALVFTEGMLFGTNCILAFSRQDQPMGLNERFDFAPTPDELTDAIQLALICFLHRQNVYLGNSVARLALVEPAVSDALLASYNDRQQRMHSSRATDEPFAILLPVLSRRFRRDDLIVNIPDGDGDEYEIFLRYFVPAPTPVEMVTDSYGYLAGKKGFAARLGSSFDTWMKAWVAFNAVMCKALALFRGSHGSVETQYFKVIRLDEYGAGAMTGCPLESLVPVVHAKATALFPDPPTLEECQLIISRLTYMDTVFDDVRFTEQPFIFYTFNGGLTLWDGLRHGGLLRSIARTLSRDSSGADHQGRALESQIALAVRRRLKVETTVGIELKERRQKVWEVDVAFLWQGVLFVVEAKNEIKNISYFFHARSVADRVEQIRAHLDKQDRKLRSFGALLRARVDKRALTTGAITVVCLREVEFIPTFAREWWLTDTCPRACRLDEFLDVLPQLDAGTLRTHPAFVAWA